MKAPQTAPPARPDRATTETTGMIALDDPSAAPAVGSFEGAGGFVWWYLELGDGAGNAVVCIWSFGLPFLPGVAGAAREGRGAPAAARPSLHIAAYRQGREELYVLHELAPREVVSRPDGWSFGASTIRRVARGDDVELQVSIDLPVHNGPRLQGELRVVGKRARWDVAAQDALPASDHRWTPLLGASFGTARLRCGDTRLLVTGRAYHDRNHAPRSLEALGIAHWVWGRVALPDHDRVFYALEPTEGREATAMAVTIGQDGLVRLEPGAKAQAGARRLTRWGMRDARRWTVETAAGQFLRLTTTAPVDDGPFYLRRLVHCEHGGHGTLEAIAPSRIDRPWQRPLVRMRVSSSRRPGSFWLPLFEGPRHRRLARLLGWRSRAEAASPASATPAEIIRPQERP